MVLYTEKGTVENFIIQELQKLGCEYVSTEEMKLRRKENFEEPLIIEDLRKALRRINSEVELTDVDLDFILVSLRNIQANIEFIWRNLNF